MSVQSLSAPAPRLSVFERQVLAWIESKGHLAQGACQSTRTIADRFGVTIRYVQRALKRLRELDMVAREWDYGLRSRRRYYPADRHSLFDGATPTPPVVNELQCAESTNSSAPTTALPLEPPLDRTLEGSLQGRDREAPAAPQEPTRAEERRTVVEAKAVVDRVAKVASRPDPQLARRIEGVCRKWGLTWLLPAVERLEHRARTRSIPDPVAYLVGILRGFEREGLPSADSPPAAPPPRTSGPAWDPDEMREAYKRYIAERPDGY